MRYARRVALVAGAAVLLLWAGLPVQGEAAPRGLNRSNGSRRSRNGHRSPYSEISRTIRSSRGAVTTWMKNLVALPAVAPESGGKGEGRKAAYIVKSLRQIGIKEIKQINAPDKRVKGGRPNIVARIPGQDRSKTLWLISHIDVVAPGDRKAWKSDPFKLTVKGNRLIGRGTTDNNVGIVSSLLLADSLRGKKLPCNLGLIFVADEETGDKYGMHHLLRTQKALFGKRDLFIIPDAGNLKGTMMEVAEKALLQLKFTVKGKQAHAAMPSNGINATVAAAQLVGELSKKLPARYRAKDKLYAQPASTFTVTTVEGNNVVVNAIPGRQTFHLDARLLPRHDMSKVESYIRQIAGRLDRRHGTKTQVKVTAKMPAAKPTSVKSEVSVALDRAVSDVLRVKTVPMGEGGRTIASDLRKKGLSAVVWGIMDDRVMHAPNESVNIRHIQKTAQVFARMLFPE